MFHAKTLKDLLKTIPLTEDFYGDLGSFQLNYIDMCFKKSLDEQIGMMSEVEYHNYELFLKYKELARTERSSVRLLNKLNHSFIPNWITQKIRTKK